MTSKGAAEGEFRYSSPSQEAEFTLYNFHPQDIVDRTADALSSKSAAGGRVIQLFGDERSGRHYLLRSAAFQASSRGDGTVFVDKLELDGYEPDTPLRGLLEFLSSRSLDST